MMKHCYIKAGNWSLMDDISNNDKDCEKRCARYFVFPVKNIISNSLQPHMYTSNKKNLLPAC